MKIKGKQWMLEGRFEKKMRWCKIVMIRIVKKMNGVRNEAFPPKLGCLNYNVGG